MHRQFLQPAVDLIQTVVVLPGRTPTQFHQGGIDAQPMQPGRQAALETEPRQLAVGVAGAGPLRPALAVEASCAGGAELADRAAAVLLHVGPVPLLHAQFGRRHRPSSLRMCSAKSLTFQSETPLGIVTIFWQLVHFTFVRPCSRRTWAERRDQRWMRLLSSRASCANAQTGLSFSPQSRQVTSDARSSTRKWLWAQLP
ncbi:hypothetical protein G6F50_014575 [Rhizopus delemar]|uniref:Uncharacterized protein n=1 Tax=Rhizopus delemar TaxID=936053 RepID=A0A9P6Y481_9FUNG|nr:hypothetical protein G6F50_014575 [Rhizopus delemar]